MSWMPWWLPFGRVPEIEATELAERLAAGPPVKLIDVRTAAEYRRGHIAGSISVPIATLPSRLDELELDGDEMVVAICLSAHRSIPAVRLLRKNGARKAVQLAGGMKAWWAADLPTDAPTSE